MRTFGTMLLLALAAAATAACSDPDPDPSATVTAAAPATLHVSDDYRNDLTITIDYADGDGDLGHGLARITDCRGDGLVTELALPAIASDAAVEKGAPITGSLDLLLNDVGDVTGATVPIVCTELGAPPPATGEAAFCVTLVDAKGHEGPGDCTDPIAIAP